MTFTTADFYWYSDSAFIFPDSGDDAASYSIAADAGTIALNGQAADLTAVLTLSADGGTVALNGGISNGLIFSGTQFGTFVLSGQNATLRAGYTLTANARSFNATGINATFSAVLRMSAAASSFALTGNGVFPPVLPWMPNKIYLAGYVVSASALQASGLLFRCIVTGASGATEPAWPTSIGDITPDGAIAWQAISSVYDELAKVAPSAIIELFELTLDAALHGSTDTYRWHAGANANITGNITWNGNQYMRLPITAEGFEYSNGGSLPRPTLTAANLNSGISALLLLVNEITPGNDLGGAKVVRIRTLAKYLDGQPNADPRVKFPDEIWYIDRKASENRDVVSFELASKFDLAGVMLPKRQCIANICQWQYKGPECAFDPLGAIARPLPEHYVNNGYNEGRNINSGGQFNATYYLATYGDVAANYTNANANEHYRNYGIWEGRFGNAGGAFDKAYYLATYPDLNFIVYYDANDQGVGSAALDVCSKRLTGCRARHGATAELPFGSFPGLGLVQ